MLRRLQEARHGTKVPTRFMQDTKRTIEHAVRSIDAAPEGEQPFHHLRLRDFFPHDLYAAMVAAMPANGDYRGMSGRARTDTQRDGVATRTKIDLFPESVRRLPDAKRPVWDVVTAALRSPEVRDAFVRRLSLPLERRFGSRYRQLGFYPIPSLTRDVAGYSIGVHPDTRWKGITVQLYLPRDESIAHVGTVFHRKVGPGKQYEVGVKMPFTPNSGYAFAVGPDTYHSVDTVGPEVSTRDSILLTYFIDDTWVQVVQNRAKRLGNAVRSLV